MVRPETRILLNPDIEASALRSKFCCKFNFSSCAVMQLVRAFTCRDADTLFCDRTPISRAFEPMSRIKWFCAAGFTQVIGVYDNASSSAQCLALTLGARCANYVIHSLLILVGTAGVQCHKNKQWTQSDCYSRCKVRIVVKVMHWEVIVLPSSVIYWWLMITQFFHAS